MFEEAKRLKAKAKDLEKEARKTRSFVYDEAVSAVEADRGSVICYTESRDYYVHDDEIDQHIKTLTNEDIAEYLAKHCDGERITLGGTRRWGDMLNPFFHRRFEDTTPGDGHWCGIGGGDGEPRKRKSPAASGKH